MDNIYKKDREKFQKLLTRDYERLAAAAEESSDKALLFRIQMEKKRLDRLYYMLAAADLYIEYLEKYIELIGKGNK